MAGKTVKTFSEEVGEAVQAIAIKHNATHEQVARVGKAIMFAAMDSRKDSNEDRPHNS